ncbi:MAG: heme-binding domain-containing protein [Vicinamibacterales bacterium]
MRSRRWLLTGVMIGLLGITVLVQRGAVAPPADPALAVGSAARVPAAVLSTMQRSCFDCHSNDTRWPWYSWIPPASWLVVHDVKDGRGQLNFSRWADYNPYDRADLLDKVCDMVSKKRMPMWQYLLLHHDARLSDADVTALCDWSHVEADRLVQGGP